MPVFHFQHFKSNTVSRSTMNIFDSPSNWQFSFPFVNKNRILLCMALLLAVLSPFHSKLKFQTAAPSLDIGRKRSGKLGFFLSFIQ